MDGGREKRGKEERDVEERGGIYEGERRGGVGEMKLEEERKVKVFFV